MIREGYVKEIKNDIVVDEIKFFFFGCWNKNACDELSNLTAVVDEIETKSFHFGIICGDNVYPDKSKNKDGDKVKDFPPNRLRNGIKCLSRINKPLYAVLGNHDIENCNVMDEMFNIKKDNNLWNIGTLYGLHFIQNQTLMLFIDTNLFNEDNNCYKTRNKNIRGECEKTIKWIDHQISLAIMANDITNIIIVGHEPLFAYKLKKEKIIATYYNSYIELINKLLSHNKKIIYLCADMHNFQHIILQSKTGEGTIEIFVAGTGGASPDKIINTEDLNNDLTNFETFTSTLLKTDNPYGYCSAKFSNNNYNIEYKIVT